MAPEYEHELHQLFDREVPAAAQRGIVKGIEVAYRVSDESCKRDYDARLWPQAWGYLRWLQVDSQLLAVGERFGKASQFPKNTPNTHIGHTELTFGQLVLSAACIQPGGNGKVRAAAYRDILSESNQLQLFERHAKKKKLWAAILHVPNVAARVPLRIYIGFVAADYTFAAPKLDLVAHVAAKKSATDLKLRKMDETGEIGG